jgi:signal transduction histidine kinase
MARIYAEINPDSAYQYAERSLELARKMNFKLDEGSSLREMGYSLLNKGNFPRSLQLVLQAMSILENPNSEQKVLVGRFPGDDELMYRTGSPHIQRLSEIAFTHQIWGVLYANLNNYEKALYRHHQAIIRAEESGNIPLQSVINMTMGRMYLNLKKTDSALYRLNKAYEQAMQTGYRRYTGSTLLNMGRVYSIMGNKLLANDYYRKSLVASAEHSYFRGVVASNHLLAEYYRQQSRKDSFFYHINAALSEARNLDAPELLLRSYTSLANYYQTTGNNDSAVKYLRLIIEINDSSLTVKNAQQFQNIDFDEQQRQQEKEAAVKAYKIRLRMYALLGGLGIFLLVAIILWRNNRTRQRAYSLLIKQKQQTDFQKTKVEETLKELKLTQTQLIQSEKMASLGELTAGIAHEIQNPLNFVNNFSEVNTELIDELRQEIDKGNYEDVKSLATSISENEQKINHHGKRADAIVKSMLQHSRTSSGKKESTDINALVDEYLRLAYHGMRAKEKSFNITIDSKFDEAIEPINIIPQDIGRVVLNLITNAFYAINEKKKLKIEGYEPRIEVSTKRLADTIAIRVSDNGTGIPQKVMDKIFQPFFTTKPTGQGTGLGLSLSYDIIKTHGGELKVETNENEGTIFVIELPLKNEV